VLSRFRSKLTPLVESLARGFIAAKIDPNVLTLMGLVAAILCIPSAYLARGLVPVLIVLSSLLDALDGAVARALNRVSRFGAFLDSFTDRLQEFLYLIALSILGLDPYIAMLILAFSYLTSYLRALGELRGVKMEGHGILERSDRAILFLILSMLGALGMRNYMNILGFVMAILCGATVIQRFLRVGKALRLLE